MDYDSHRTKSPTGFREKSTSKNIGPTLDNDRTWRIKINEELEILIKKNIL